MLKINEKEKTVVYTETWSIKDVQYIFESKGIYEDVPLTSVDLWNILKNAVEKADFWNTVLNEDVIDYVIGEYIEENF